MKPKAKRKLIALEQRALKFKQARMLGIINRILEQEFQRKIYNCPESNQMRLLIFDVWRQKYKVSLRFILRAILPTYLKASEKYGKQRGGPPRGLKALGIPIPMITGKKSEEVLQFWLGRAYPDRENYSMWRQRARRRVIDKRLGNDEEDEYRPRLRNLLECNSIEEYVKRYGKRIKEERKLRNDIESAANNKVRPYRDSPWI